METNNSDTELEGIDPVDSMTMNVEQLEEILKESSGEKRVKILIDGVAKDIGMVEDEDDYVLIRQL